MHLIIILSTANRTRKTLNGQRKTAYNSGLLSVGARNEQETINKLINGSGKRQEIGI